MAEVALAFLWHQHQPYYPDDVGGDNPMPWVRLHGVKDYYGMALHLLEFPEMRCTINLVPSLLVQLERYTEHGGSDRFLDVSRLPADSLSETDAVFLLDNFFMANAERMILPYPRYAELFQRRGLGRNSARESLRRFNERDLRDLQVWFNLTWIHPLAFERDAELRSLRDKGRAFSEDDKRLVLEKHLAILREVIPLHRRLAERDQVELTTTPFFHPILPLLLDKKLTREAMPDAKLPRYTGGYPEDAAVHLSRAIESHEKFFGRRPQGMWPAEGSVCQPMIPLLARNGIRWIATDEDILRHSTQGAVSRDARGHVRHPERMYRPYKVAQDGHELGIVFRDHALSDMIGFHYQRSEPIAAAEDLVGHVEAIGRAVEGKEPALVCIILDGENCWEHYPEGGVPFLRALYERCCGSEKIQPVQIGEFLEQHSPKETLPHLFAGSWIHHNFAIWIGHEEDNTAWDALHQTREHLRRAASERTLPQDLLSRAWEEIFIAEGSDWFWWYGDDHSCAQDALFDFLFRKHLQNVYLLLGDQPPAELSRVIRKRCQRLPHTLPKSLLDVRVDGRRTFLKWMGAGRYSVRNEAGSMDMASSRPIRDVYFGFDLEQLVIRVDFAAAARSVLSAFDRLRIGFVQPTGVEFSIPLINGIVAGEMRLRHEGVVMEAEGARAAVGQILEASIPFERLHATVGEPIEFFVELFAGERSCDRAPAEGVIRVTRPGPDFEQIMWDV